MSLPSLSRRRKLLNPLHEIARGPVLRTHRVEDGFNPRPAGVPGATSASHHGTQFRGADHLNIRAVPENVQLARTGLCLRRLA